MASSFAGRAAEDALVDQDAGDRGRAWQGQAHRHVMAAIEVSEGKASLALLFADLPAKREAAERRAQSLVAGAFAGHAVMAPAGIERSRHRFPFGLMANALAARIAFAGFAVTRRIMAFDSDCVAQRS